MAGIKWSAQDVIDTFAPYLSNIIKEQQNSAPPNRSNLFNQLTTKAKSFMARPQPNQTIPPSAAPPSMPPNPMSGQGGQPL